jgi:opacity protein-like surface antigen
LTNVDIFPHVGTVYPVRDYMGTLSAVVHAPVSRYHFKPYVEGGVEYDRYAPSQSAINYAYDFGWASASQVIMNHNDKFGFNLGGGLDRKLGKRLTFRIDVRDHVTSSPAFGIPYASPTQDTAIYPVKGRAGNLVYSAGIVYHLGKL